MILEKKEILSLAMYLKCRSYMILSQVTSKYLLNSNETSEIRFTIAINSVEMKHYSYYCFFAKILIECESV